MSNPAASALIAKLRADAEAHRMRLQVAEVLRSDDFERAFSAIRRENTESLLLPPEPLVRANRERIAEFALAHKLALAIAGSRRYLPQGGLISYGPTTPQYARITGGYIDRILKLTQAISRSNSLPGLSSLSIQRLRRLWG